MLVVVIKCLYFILVKEFECNVRVVVDWLVIFKLKGYMFVLYVIFKKLNLNLK